jgi:hypothetical protein
VKQTLPERVVQTIRQSGALEAIDVWQKDMTIADKKFPYAEHIFFFIVCTASARSKDALTLSVYNFRFQSYEKTISERHYISLLQSHIL